MRTLKISFILLVTIFLFVTFAPQRNEANRRVLQKIKKIAALSILLKPKKLLALPLPLPLPLPIPIIKKSHPEPWPQPSWPAPESMSWPVESWGDSGWGGESSWA